jgi:hypothetical protein
MRKAGASAPHRRLITFSVFGIVILALCACGNLSPGRPGPRKTPNYDYNELDSRSCPQLVGDVVADSRSRSSSCFMATTTATDKRLLALIVKDIVHEQQLTAAGDGVVELVWVPFDHPGDNNFEAFATGFYFEDKDDAAFVLSDEELRRATVVDNVYVLEGSLNFY